MRLQKAGYHPRRTDQCRQPCARRMEPRLQPKTGGLAPQAVGSAGRSRSSREQAPAYYTSVRQPANRCETVEALHWDQGSSRSHAAKRATPSLTRRTETVPGRASEQVRCKRQQVAHRGKWPAACRPPAFGGLLPAGSSRRTPHEARSDSVAAGLGIHIYQ